MQQFSFFLKIYLSINLKSIFKFSLSFYLLNYIILFGNISYDRIINIKTIL